MIQCGDGHLFCQECMMKYSAVLLGEHNPQIVCMDLSGCKHPFAETELSRFMPEKMMELYQCLKQTKEIEEAEIEGLEGCPFCEYKAIVDQADEKLFQCERKDCGVVSCRMCKKLVRIAPSSWWISPKMCLRITALKPVKVM